jgi:hypothetical protein
MEKKQIKWWKWALVLTLVCMNIAVLWKGNTVMAAMADEAEDYELGESYNGYVSIWEHRYFKFTVSEKSRVTLTAQKNGDYTGEYTIYNASGKTVLQAEDLRFPTNTVTSVTKAAVSRTLQKGTYYLDIYGNSSHSGEFTFTIQAEKQITLSRGKITSLKSEKAGTMTVKYNSAADAIGYRIIYATNDSFTKNVKTIYVSGTSKKVSGLKKGVRYYVKVCPYTVYDDGSRVYGQNSMVKAVTVKK